MAAILGGRVLRVHTELAHSTGMGTPELAFGGGRESKPIERQGTRPYPLRILRLAAFDQYYSPKGGVPG